jgi:hypothetical protein
MITAGLISLFVAVVPLIIWAVKRWAQQADDPTTREQLYENQVYREVATDDERAANVRLDAGLRALHSRSAGQGSAPVDAPKDV